MLPFRRLRVAKVGPQAVEPVVYATVRYPVLAYGASPKLQKRWNELTAVMMQPVDFHMRQARSEAAALDTFWRQNFAMPGDPRCVRLNKLVRSQALSVTDKYEVLGRPYQMRQTRRGGPIDRAIKEFNKEPQP